MIDVSRLYNTDVPEFSARQHIGATAFDASRSFIDHISPFPDNIEAEVTATYTRAAGRGGGSGRRPRRRFGGGTMRGNSATIVLHHSMVRLPEHPMMPRLFDERVGYFTTRTEDYTADEYRARNRAVHRALAAGKERPQRRGFRPGEAHRLLHRCGHAEEVGAVAEEGRRRLERSFRWPPASRTPSSPRTRPRPQEDPDFSPEDVRYSVIRWLPSTVENASGPHISDPRTGEILNADIQFYNNVMVLARDWYFVQVGPLDPRAQKLPLPDDLMGRLLEYVVCHEVGHTTRLPAQHEGQLDVSRRQDPRQGLGPQDGPHAFDHGLLALQLCGAAGRPHRGGRPDSAHRTV